MMYSIDDDVIIYLHFVDKSFWVQFARYRVAKIQKIGPTQIGPILWISKKYLIYNYKKYPQYKELCRKSQHTIFKTN